MKYWNANFTGGNMILFLSFLSYRKCMHFRFANNYTHSKISRRDNVERRIKFKEGKLPRERRRSCGSIARKTSFKKCFHLRTNFLFYFFFFSFLRSLFLCFLCTARSLCWAKFRQSSLARKLVLREGEVLPQKRGTKLSHYVLHYDLIHLHKKLLAGNKDPSSLSPMKGKSAYSDGPIEGATRVYVKDHKQLNYLNKL